MIRKTGKEGVKGSTRRGAKLTTRSKTVRVKTAKRRKTSSTLWLRRQLNDPYVAEARHLGYRSRAAFKLIELDDRYHFLRPGLSIVDLGAAPGGWTQIAVKRVKSESTSAGKKAGQVVALDISEMEPMPGATFLHCDFLDAAAPGMLIDAMDGPADVVLSDMAAPVTGHGPTDHLRIMGLCEAALEFAEQVLTPGGVFIAKMFQGGTENQLLDVMKQKFRTVRHAKPPSSRADSSEVYVIASGFKGKAKAADSDGDTIGNG